MSIPVLQIYRPDTDVDNTGWLGYPLRASTRGVVLNSRDEIALMHYVHGAWEYDLPGGRMDPGESIEQCFIRECHEEIGCEVIIQSQIGMTIEYRDQTKLTKYNHFFMAHVDQYHGQVQLDPAELQWGTEHLWVSLEKAIILLSLEPKPFTNHYYRHARALDNLMCISEVQKMLQ